MFCYDPKPKKEFCTLVAKKLVKKYQFMKDTGEKVSGYGSWKKKLIEKSIIYNLKQKDLLMMEKHLNHSVGDPKYPKC